MTKKDFVLVAKAIGAGNKRALSYYKNGIKGELLMECGMVADELTNAFEKDNERFNRKKFWDKIRSSL